jgi:hypothetical protein
MYSLNVLGILKFIVLKGTVFCEMSLCNPVESSIGPQYERRGKVDA